MPDAKVPERGRKKRANIKRFFAETRSELKKIVWPTRKQVLNNTIVVIIAILIVGIFIWLLDALTSSTLGFLLNRF
jgi:preprotein translocase subunit SecE